MRTSCTTPTLTSFLRTGRLRSFRLLGRPVPLGADCGWAWQPRPPRAFIAQCHADSKLVQICYNAPRFDERVLLVVVADGRVSRIDIGRIIHEPCWACGLTIA